MTPDGLGPGGVAFWEEVTRDYELNPAERRGLEDACREIDLIDALQVLVDRAAKEGTLDECRAVTEIRLHRGTLERIKSGLGLDGGASSSPSAAGRALVSNRWNKRAQ